MLYCQSSGKPGSHFAHGCFSKRHPCDTDGFSRHALVAEQTSPAPAPPLPRGQQHPQKGSSFSEQRPLEWFRGRVHPASHLPINSFPWHPKWISGEFHLYGIPVTFLPLSELPLRPPSGSGFGSAWGLFPRGTASAPRVVAGPYICLLEP